MPASKSLIVPGIRPLIYLFVLLLSAGCATAQPGKPSRTTLSKKDQQAFMEARADYDARQYLQSAATIEQLLKKNSNAPELYYLHALVQRRLGKYDLALSSLQRGRKVDPAPVPQLYVELAQIHAQMGDFDKSVAAYSAYLNTLPANASPARRNRALHLLERAKVAEQIARTPVPFRPTPLSGGVNTTDNDEYFPSLSVDGQSLVFTRRIKRRNEDFFRSDLQADGTWSDAQPLLGVNTDYNEGAQSMSADGTFLVFTICGQEANRGSCDLYFSEKVTETGWSPAQTLGQVINTEFRETQPALSADGRLLFFSSNRPGGAGGEDLYVSGRLPDGRWSTPVNLGNTVNSPGDEQFPFWAADGSTLFYTSTGLPGLGGQDLFRTQLSPQNTWEAPVNLGYPINTASDETNLFIGLNGSTAYFSKRVVNPETGDGDIDIYSFELPPNLQPTAATYLAATVIDAVSKKAIKANVRVAPLSQDAPPSYIQTDDNGAFLSVLPAGKDYAVTVDQEGYLFYSDRFALAGDLNPKAPFELTIELTPVATVLDNGGDDTDGSIAFKNVLFETGSADLLSISNQELDRLAEVLFQSPELRVEIAGHTDDIGDDQDNQLLSEARAQAVGLYIQAQGISPDRISTKGYGERQPIASNDTEEGRAKNRRTTFRLIR